MINNDSMQANVQYKGILNGEGEYTVSVEGKNYIVSQDKQGNLSVNPRLKGQALEDAKRGLDIAKQAQKALNEQAQETLKQMQLKEAQANLPPRKIHPFIPAKNSLLSAVQLDNSTLSILEKNIGDYLELCIPSVGLEQLQALSTKLNTLSQERKTNVENKFWFIGRFFHKLNQAFKGGGFRTLAERADALRVKIDGLKPQQEKRVEQSKRDVLKWKLEEIAKGTEDGKLFQKDTLEEINKMEKNEFEEAMSVFFSKDKFVSANIIYRELSTEKRKMFDDLLLAQEHWYSLAESHFAKNYFNSESVMEIPGFDKERYLAKFLGEYKAIFEKENNFLRSSRFLDRLATYIGDCAGQIAKKPSLEDFISENGNEFPKYLSNDFLRNMFKEALIKYVKEEDWTKVTELLDLLNLSSALETDNLYFVRNPFANAWTFMTLKENPDFVAQIEKTIAETTINEIFNTENSLPKEVVDALKDNVDCEAYGIFPEKTTVAAAK